MGQKARQITRVYILINNNFCWTKKVDESGRTERRSLGTEISKTKKQREMIITEEILVAKVGRDVQVQTNTEQTL